MNFSRLKPISGVYLTLKPKLQYSFVDFLSVSELSFCLGLLLVFFRTFNIEVQRKTAATHKMLLRKIGATLVESM